MLPATFRTTPSHPIRRILRHSAALPTPPAPSLLPAQTGPVVGRCISSSPRPRRLSPAAGERFSRPHARAHIMRAGGHETAPIPPGFSFTNRVLGITRTLSTSTSSLRLLDLAPAGSTKDRQREMSESQRKAPSKAVQLALDAGAPTIDPSTVRPSSLPTTYPCSG
ncbi:hypothetical protein CALCODRAFT_501397 [Calocera cornea HHB12733]|uniref:Uncharacterized protein n=1 Tax=Calocera cornea HHB12733 TaxID=1353952 RepID=A0A165DNL5_9BASI|nr:hypothetical protein CALCODRAFT_501397 [Calocera cornea HHB12733]